MESSHSCAPSRAVCLINGRVGVQDKSLITCLDSPRLSQQTCESRPVDNSLSKQTRGMLSYVLVRRRTLRLFSGLNRTEIRLNLSFAD